MIHLQTLIDIATAPETATIVAVAGAIAAIAGALAAIARAIEALARLAARLIRQWRRRAESAPKP